MCWRERITICCFLTMPIHDHDRRLGTGGVAQIGTDWSREMAQAEFHNVTRLLHRTGAIGVMEKAAMRTTNSEGWRTRQHNAISKQR